MKYTEIDTTEYIYFECPLCGRDNSLRKYVSETIELSTYADGCWKIFTF